MSGGAPWYQTAFDEDYLERYAHRDADEAARQLQFLRSAGWLPSAGSAVLDLCCGGGRHSAWLCAHGFRPIGADLSPGLLRSAARAVAAAGCAPRLARADMRALPFRDASCDGALQMFTSFGYFAADAENERVLRETARVLRPGAPHVLDLMNAARTVATLEEASAVDGPGGARIHVTRRHDPVRRRIEKEMRIVHGDGSTATRFESVRLYARAEIEELLARAGFERITAYGDFGGAAFDAARSERMIVAARRAPGR